MWTGSVVNVRGASADEPKMRLPVSFNHAGPFLMCSQTWLGPAVKIAQATTSAMRTAMMAGQLK